ncbi:MAG: hypothetical protein M1812_000595 [Candelaria pacifica]|nr:MAG: hypothetical protein M1812_000595 [Candelaria pacifica]
MHYIRFLKPPRLCPSTSSDQYSQVKTLITITSDLGDAFYSEDVTVWAIIRDSGIPQTGCRDEKWMPFEWRAGNRTLPICYTFHHSNISWPIRLQVTTRKGSLADGSVISDAENHGMQLPTIISAWSTPLLKTPDQEVQRVVERRFALSSSQVLHIYEETGDSIAKHIWDAGLALSYYLSQTIHSKSHSQLPHLNSLLKTPTSTGLRILELGAGCGIVSLSLAKQLPNSRILLTDTSEAQALTNRNIDSFLSSSPTISTISFEILQWEETIPEKVAKLNFDLILVADCTYNPSSVPALVTTLSALIRRSSHPLIVIAMKVRHESEKNFFDLMAKAGLKEVGHTIVQLPGAFEDSEEKVDIYEYVGSEGKTTT